MYAKILVPVDGSDASNLGLSEAIKVAKNQGSQLRLVHIVNELVIDYTYSAGLYSSELIDALREGGKNILDQAVGIVRQHGISCERRLIESIGGRAADLIVAQSQEWPADLIVMGTHGRRGLRRLSLGSDSEQVVRESTVPVLLVRAPSEKATAAAKSAAA